MKSNRIKNSVTYLFLVLFLSMKLVGLHALSHVDDKDEHAVHCVICDHAITHNLTPILTPDLDVFSIEHTEDVVEQEVIVDYNFILSSSIASNQLFSRPPPSIA